MKVILTQDVRGQGKRGQMIEVSDGYARNFLLPRKLAQEATADNVNTMKMNDKAAQERQAKERAEALEIRNRMKEHRARLGLKQEELAKLVGVRRETIGNLEKGRYNPSLVLAWNIAKVFGVPIEEVFTVEPDGPAEHS